MGKIVVPRGQQEMVRRLHPKPAYSRIVGFSFTVPKTGAQTQWDITEALGQNLWVLRTQLWFKAETPGVSRRFNWKVVIVGRGKVTGPQIMNELESFVKVRYASKPYGTFVGSDVYFDFHMMRFYEGEPKRLIAWCYNDSQDDPLWVQAMFTISEG